MSLRPPRFCLVLSEALFVVAVIAALVSQVISERVSNGVTSPHWLSWAESFAEFWGWRWVAGATVSATLCATLTAIGVLRVLPVSLRTHFLWFRGIEGGHRIHPSTPNVRPYSRLTLVAIGLALTSSLALGGVAWHATIDRTHHVPVVTWSGPLVNALVPVTVAGLLSLLVSSVQLYKIVDRSPYFFDFLAWVGMAIVLLNLLGILVFFGQAGVD